ncbi:ABC transporter permease [Arenibacter troitsensis]|uniref:Lipoprotein-releasing system permease protein n=1 Tax=Arenibacter troitsensis TaxID=188872 RepID=A0A1X7L6L9_9FLAO|nr:FtsX-like permease family protein [Arenibacter troitsensis]SMG49518.1 lipoprotein-releasing system permease protein [Arenibacter troitsensis]
MNFPLYIAKRYLRSKSSQNAVNIINFITFLVIVIGSAALFIVLSGFAGLKTFSLSYTNMVDPDLKALPLTGKFFSVSESQDQALQQLKDVAAYSKEIEEKVYLTHDQKAHIAYIKGIDSTFTKTTPIDSSLYFYGDWAVNSLQGVVGQGIVNLLGLNINNFRSPLVIRVPKPGKGLLGQRLLKDSYNETNLVISGIYQIEEELDRKYVFADLPMVQALLEKDSTQISGINFKLKEGANVPDLRQQIENILPGQVILKDRRELNSTLHRMLNTENLATYLIFTLVLIIALFNVVGAIIMMILDKQQNSKTLYNLGTTIKALRKIYFVQGILVTGLGGLIGVFLGSMLIWSQLAFGWLKITPSLSYPVEYSLINVFIVLATIIVLGIIASLIASSRINKKLIAH